MFSPMLPGNRMPELDFETPDLILVMLARGGGPQGFRGITRLEKLVFLLTQEGRIDAIKVPKFDAYKYGPYSKEIYDSIEFLKSIELVQAEESTESSEDAVELRELDPDVAPAYEPRVFRLTKRGQKVAARLAEKMDNSVLRSIEKIIESYGRMPLPQLIRYVYSQYPKYTSRSLIRAQVLG